jgi:hypothetical protein
MTRFAARPVEQLTENATTNISNIADTSNATLACNDPGAWVTGFFIFRMSLFNQSIQ